MSVHNVYSNHSEVGNRESHDQRRKSESYHKSDEIFHERTGNDREGRTDGDRHVHGLERHLNKCTRIARNTRNTETKLRVKKAT